MYPIIIITITAIISLYLGLFSTTKPFVFIFNILGILLALGMSVILWNHPQSYFNDMIRSDPYSIAYSVILLVATALLIIISKRFMETIGPHLSEYYSILLFALAGGLMMVSFQNLTMLFVGLEILSVSVYILTGIQKKDKLGNEAAIKYFLMGSFFTAILLLGIAFLYGGTGTFNISEMETVIQAGRTLPSFFHIGIILVLIALCFKVSVAPFHFWTPDVYEGAPVLVTSFMSTVVKIAGFGAFLRLFYTAFPTTSPTISFILWILVAITLFIGNINALYQTSMKSC
jgi:NADH-quinone oxidoreductase subunit N